MRILAAIHSGEAIEKISSVSPITPCVTLSDLIENPDPYASSLATWVWIAIFMRHPRRFEWGAGSHYTGDGNLPDTTEIPIQ